MKPNFNVEAHYESKIRQGSIKDQGSFLNFRNVPFIPKNVEIQKGLKRIKMDKFKYDDFKIINQLHQEYLKEIKGVLSHTAFLDIIYKAELTGAKIEIAGKEGFVIQERKNTIFVIFPGNITKIFPKKIWDFKLKFEDVEYLFFAKALKNGRFFK